MSYLNNNHVYKHIPTLLYTIINQVHIRHITFQSLTFNSQFNQHIVISKLYYTKHPHILWFIISFILILFTYLWIQPFQFINNYCIYNSCKSFRLFINYLMFTTLMNHYHIYISAHYCASIHILLVHIIVHHHDMSNFHIPMDSYTIPVLTSQSCEFNSMSTHL